MKPDYEIEYEGPSILTPEQAVGFIFGHWRFILAVSSSTIPDEQVKAYMSLDPTFAGRQDDPLSQIKAERMMHSMFTNYGFQSANVMKMDFYKKDEPEVTGDLEKEVVIPEDNRQRRLQPAGNIHRYILSQEGRKLFGIIEEIQAQDPKILQEISDRHLPLMGNNGKNPSKTMIMLMAFARQEGSELSKEDISALFPGELQPDGQSHHPGLYDVYKNLRDIVMAKVWIIRNRPRKSSKWIDNIVDGVTLTDFGERVVSAIKVIIEGIESKPKFTEAGWRKITIE